MKCPKCQFEVERGMKYCPYCGEAMIEKNDDQPSFLIALISFINPIIGIILYFILYKESPQRAKSATKGTILGVVTSIVITILLFLFVLSFSFY